MINNILHFWKALITREYRRRIVLIPALAGIMIVDIATIGGYLEKFIATQRQNAFLWTPVLYGVGIGIYFALRVEPPWQAGAVAVTISAVIAAIQVFRHKGVDWLAATMIAVFLVAAGWSTAQIRTHIVAAPALDREMSPVMVEGTIVSLDALEEGKGTRVVLRDPVIEKLLPEKTPARVRISIRKDEGLLPGQRIRVMAGLNPPSPPGLPGGFDFQRHMFFMRIGAMGFAYKAPEIIAESAGTGDLIEVFRQKKSKEIHDILPVPESAIVAALLLGERAAIPVATWEDIRSAGLAHVISISGMHIGMIAGVLFFFSRGGMALFPRFALYHPIKKYAALIAMAGAIAYALMVGLSVPTLRAVIMTGMVMTAIMLDRSPFSMRIVAVSAMIILVTTPEAIFNPGFQMSFGAVAALIFSYDETRGFWSRVNRSRAWWKKPVVIILGSAFTSLAATVATAPYTLYHFQQFPIYSVIGNVLAMPVIGIVVMPAALIAYFLMPLGLDALPLRAMGWGVSLMLDISAEIATWPEADLNMPAWPRSALLLFTAAGLVMLLVRGAAQWFSLVPLVAGVVAVMAHPQPDVLVSGSGKLAMVRLAPDIVLLNTRRTERFIAGNWLRAAGLEGQAVPTFPREGTIADTASGNALSCDPGGCRIRIGRHTIALSHNQRIAAEDCGHVDVVISTKPLRRCEGSYLIDMWDLRRDGTHAIYISGNTVRIQNITDTRGSRPWTISRGY